MTPKEEAKELVEEYYNIIPRTGYFHDNWQQAKKGALIYVMRALREVIGYSVWCHHMDVKTFQEDIEYWQEVKEEIKKL